MKILKKLLFFFTPAEKKRAGMLLIMILIMALIDMLGIASIMPFMAVLSNPSLIETNVVLKSMFQASRVIGIETNQEFIFTLGILVFILLIFSISFKALTTYFQSRFVMMREYSISKRLVETYLHQPYSWFLNRNSAELGKSILSDTGFIIGQAISPMMELISKSIVVITLIALLLYVDIKLTLIVIFILVGSYVLIYKSFIRFLNRIGKEVFDSNQSRFTAVSEALGASKEIKIGRLEKIFIKKFSDPALIFAKNQISSTIIGQMPRFLIEGISFGGMILLVLYLISKTGTFAEAIPVIAVYAFVAYRLLPSIQQIYQARSTLKFSEATINNLYNDLKNLKVPNLNHDQGILSFNKAINLNNINYNYPNSSRTVLKNVNLNIPIRTTTGIVGATGCGKTTIADIILGLLEPQKGTVEVDGKIITKDNIRSWQRSIGYVPQQIYLSDNTIAANIAFGCDQKNINQELVDNAAKIANLHDFVIDELPNKYQTIVGERGVRLSGGQRQRIGIARALYHSPKVLILDEATSALDNQTEQIVMDTISNLNKEITIILIAHRLTTLKKCDNIFFLEKGEVKAELSFDELMKDNKYFSTFVEN